METRRFILALAMSLLVFLVYVRFFAPAPPEQPVQEPVREAPREDARSSVAPSFPEPARMTFRPPSKGKDISVETDLVTAVINTAGGVITSWELKNYQEVDRSPAGVAALYQKLSGQKQKKKKTGNVQLVPAYEGILTRDRVYPLAVTPIDRALAPLAYGLYRANHGKIVLDDAKKSETLVLTYRGPAGILIEKRLTFYHDDYKVDVEIRTKRLNGYSLSLGTDFGIADKVSRDAKGRVGLIAMLDGGKEREKIEKIKGEKQHAGTIDWFGQEDKYFTATMLYGKPGIITSRTVSGPEEVGDFLNTELIVKDKPESQAYMLYAGPKNYFEV